MTVLLMVAGLLISSEVGLRIFASPKSPFNIRLATTKQIDPITGFRFKPHLLLNSGDRTNEKGYLAPSNLTNEVPEEMMRLLYIGDSSMVPKVMGKGIAAQTQEIVEARGLGDVQTVNTAVPGFSPENALAMYEHEIHELDADYVFIYLGWNALGQYGPEGLAYKRARAGYPVPWYQKLLNYFYTPRLYYQARRSYRAHFVETVNRDLTPSEAETYAAFEPTFFEEKMRRLLALTRDRYPRVYVLSLFTLTSYSPTPDEMARIHFPVGMGKNVRKLHLLLTKYNETLRRVATEEGIPIIESFELFATPEHRKLLIDTSHQNEDGARLIAEKLADVIEDDLSSGSGAEVEKPGIGMGPVSSPGANVRSGPRL